MPAAGWREPEWWAPEWWALPQLRPRPRRRPALGSGVHTANATHPSGARSADENGDGGKRNGDDVRDAPALRTAARAGSAPAPVPEPEPPGRRRWRGIRANGDA